VAQREDLDVFVLVAYRDQAEQGEGVGQAEVGQSQQHGRSSCRRPEVKGADVTRARHLTSTDDIFGKRTLDLRPS
jgi:hypothetical protein